MAQATTDIGNPFKRKRDEKAPGAADAVEAVPTCEWIIAANDLSIGIDLELVPLAHNDRVYHIRLNQREANKAEWSTALTNATKDEYHNLEKFRESRKCAEETLACEYAGDIMCTVADSYGLSAPTAVKVCRPIQSFSSCSSEINYDLLDLDDEDEVCLLGKGKTLTFVDDESQVVITHGDIAPTTTDLSTISSGRMLVRLKHVVAAIESVALAERTRWHAKGRQVDTSHTVCEMGDPVDDENGTTVHIYWS